MLDYQFEIPEKTSAFDSIEDKDKREDALKYYQDINIEYAIQKEIDDVLYPIASLLVGTSENIEEGIYRSKEQDHKGDLRVFKVLGKIKREFYSLTCTESDEYKEIREIAKLTFDQFVDIAAKAIAGYIGIAIEIVSALIAVLIKATARIGVVKFCRLYETP